MSNVVRLISASKSDFETMTPMDLKESIYKSEGRVIMGQHLLFAGAGLVRGVTNSELMFAFGSDMVLLNTIDFGMNPQEALDAPRFQWVGGKKVQLERAVPTDIALKLAAMGHEVEIMNDTYSMGRGEIIWRWDDEVLVGASEPRCDGHVASW